MGELFKIFERKETLLHGIYCNIRKHAKYMMKFKYAKPGSDAYFKTDIITHLLRCNKSFEGSTSTYWMTTGTYLYLDGMIVIDKNWTNIILQQKPSEIRNQQKKLQDME